MCPVPPSLYAQADDRFFWNKHLQRRLIDLTTSSTDQDVRRTSFGGVLDVQLIRPNPLVQQVHPARHVWLWVDRKSVV